MSITKKIYKLFGIPFLTREQKTISEESVRILPKVPQQSNRLLKIAITNGGGMGDSIIDVAFIQNLRQHLPEDAEIDYYAKSYNLFKNMSFFNKVSGYNVGFNPKLYDLVMTNHRFFIIGNFNEAKIQQQAPVLYRYVKYQQELRNLYSQYAKLLGKNRWEQLDLQGITGFDRNFEMYMPILTEYMSVLKRYDLAPQQYITINRGVDSDLGELCPKLWPLEYYKTLTKLLREKYPHIKLVQIGANDKYGVIGADLTLLGKTTLEETKILLKNSLLHIDVEGGLVHLNHTLHGKSCVIFGPTPKKELEYTENINIKSQGCPHYCDWVIKDWQKRCLRGYDIPPCMQETKPADIMTQITPYIDNWQNIGFKAESLNQNRISNKELHCVGEISDALIAMLSELNELIIYKDKITLADKEIANKYGCRYTLGNQYNLPLDIGKIKNFLWIPQSASLWQEYVFNELMRVLANDGKLYILAENLSEMMKRKMAITFSQREKFIEITKE